MPVIIYPPKMPLHEHQIVHRQDQEHLWANPIPFVPFLIFTTLLFLLGLWGVSKAVDLPIFHALDHRQAYYIAALIPPLVLVIMILILPQVSSPAWAYAAAVANNPLDDELRWNQAVVTSAHIYCGRTAQTEWLNLMSQLSIHDRFVALGYIKKVRSRLQQIPVLYAGDVQIAMIACLLVIFVSYFILHAEPLDALFHSLALIIVAQLLMLYLVTQRWQHIRRLMELEEIFEELLPSQHPALEPQDDEVTKWAKEHAINVPQREPRTMLEFPPAPWE